MFVLPPIRKIIEKSLAAHSDWDEEIAQTFALNLAHLYKIAMLKGVRSCEEMKKWLENMCVDL